MKYSEMTDEQLLHEATNPDWTTKHNDLLAELAIRYERLLVQYHGKPSVIPAKERFFDKGDREHSILNQNEEDTE